MASYVPLGILTDLTQSELSALRVSALAALTGGQRVSLSGGAKSGTKQYPMRPQDLLAEIKFAEQQNGTQAPRKSRVYSTFSGQFPGCNRRAIP